MLHSISANKASFHVVHFHEGLNIVLADSADNALSNDTRNSVGKTTLIKILNYCLGSSLPPAFKVPVLQDWEFYLNLTLLNQKYTITRSVSNPTKIFIDGNLSILPVQMNIEPDGKTSLPLEDWKHLLGQLLFSSNLNSRLSFRSLISYFIRSSKESYLRPEKYFSAQANSTVQLLLSFLLGLNSTYAAEWYDLNERNNSLKTLAAAQKANVGPSIGDLRTKKIQLEDALSKNKNRASSLKVHEHYEHVQDENERLTRDLHAVTNSILIFKKTRQSYLDSIENEEYPDDSYIEAIYKEAKVLFPDQVKATLNEAKKFHTDIVENRKKLIAGEIDELNRKIRSTQSKIDSLIEKRNKNISILEETSSLTELIEIQEKQSLISRELSDIEKMIADLTNIEKSKKEIVGKKDKLKAKADVYHEEVSGTWSQAITLFNAHTKILYGDKINGNLIIDITKDGYTFDINIPKSDGDGVGKMTIFAFDLMLLELQKLQRRSVDFLVHDSILYDGVDSRQVALALELANKVCQENNLQYICAFNSDAVPYSEFSPDFEFSKYVVASLSDDNIAGSLLGIDF